VFVGNVTAPEDDLILAPTVPPLKGVIDVDIVGDPI
jgi:hypothetical protein